MRQLLQPRQQDIRLADQAGSEEHRILRIVIAVLLEQIGTEAVQQLEVVLIHPQMVADAIGQVDIFEVVEGRDIGVEPIHAEAQQALGHIRGSRAPLIRHQNAARAVARTGVNVVNLYLQLTRVFHG